MRFIVIASFSLTVACGSDPVPAQDRPGASTASEGVAAPDSADGIQLRQTYRDMPAGTEGHYCQYYTLPDHPVDVQRFEHSYTEGGHHVILYPTDLTPSDIQDRPGVFDCDEVPNRGDAGFGYVGGGTRGSVEYPSGVAYHFEPNAVVLLESHMLNLGAEPLAVDYRVNLLFPSAPATDHVGTLFFYDNHIRIPESGSASVNMSCAVPRDIQVLALAPHMHVRGTQFDVWLDDGGTGPAEALLTQDDWAALDPTVYDPPLTVQAGDRFSFRCAYENPDPFAVLEGPSKTDNEMCLLIGSYYPRIDFPFEFCIEAGSGPVYEGEKTCAESFSCFVAADDPFAADHCALETCAAAGQAFNDFFNCAARECFFPGACEGRSCQACTLEHCSQEITACQEAKCE